MPNALNCCNLPCPEPVLRTRQYIAENNPAAFTITVDNQAAAENVYRFLTSQGYTVAQQQANTLWMLAAQRISAILPDSSANSTSVQNPSSSDTDCGKTLILVASSTLGNGDDSLGSRLMKSFLSTLPEMGNTLWRLVFVNGGVLLTTNNSPTLDALRALEQQGITILVCGACLEHFGVTAKKAVGETTSMLDIVSGMQLADKVIRI